MTTEDLCVLALPSSRCVCAHVCACLCLCVRACVHVPLWVSNRRLLSTQAFLRRVAFAAGKLEGGGNASHWDGELTSEGSPASHNPLSSFLWDLGRERKWLKHWCSRCYEWHNLLDRALGNLLPSARNAQLISLRRIKEIILQTNSMLHTIEEAPIRRHGKGNQESREKQIRYRFINIWL